MKYLYLLINFCTIIVPLVFSFHPKIKFYREWKSFLPALVITAVLFIIWDAAFTQLGIWQFNSKYLLGATVLGLPIEEILFFICIPYACVFTYFSLDKFYTLQWTEKNEWIVTLSFICILLICGLYFQNKIYTATTFFSTAFLCFFLKWNLGIRWMGKAFTVYAILLLPFLIVNGILTGTGIDQPVVIYNEDHFMGKRIFTIPLEDAVYGFELLLLNLLLFKWFQMGFKKGFLFAK